MAGIISVVRRGDPVVSGTPEFEAQRESIAREFAKGVPKELILPESTIANPPRDVSGVPRQSGLLTAEELEITDKYDAVALAEAIATKKLTAVAVATAFSKRAIIAHQVTNCLTEWFMDEAVERAKALDDHLAKTGKVVGPLHGVPISVKEHMPLKGHYSDVGFLDTRTLDNYDSQLIATLRAAGAVFYCKTIQPQAIMHIESVSSVYGRVLNPYNIDLTSGGSTGGEAALIAMRGSALGIGTDIGGSIRCPAGLCGIYGFKPTSYTLPMKDFIVGGFGAELQVLCSTGPMSNSLRDMDLFVSVLIASKPHLEDPRLIPIPWTGLATPAPKPLKVGILLHDGEIVPQPPVIRALKQARAQLEAAAAAPGGTGVAIEVKPFAPFKTAEAIRNIRLAYWPDGGKAVKAHLAKTGEPMLPLTQWILKDAEGPEGTASDGLQQRVVRDKFRCDFAAHWTAQDVDVVVCPVFVGPACHHETSFHWNYTAFWNYVDHPGAVLPTSVRALAKGAEDYDAEFASPISENDKYVRKLWAEGDFEGAPVDIQVVARKYHDNQLFGALNVLKDILKF